MRHYVLRVPGSRHRLRSALGRVKALLPTVAWGIVVALVLPPVAHNNHDPELDILPSCPGITLGVDYGVLDHNAELVCVTGLTQTITGRELARHAGITLEGTARIPAFVCRVQGRPTATERIPAAGHHITEACVHTPQATAYWTLWVKENATTSFEYAHYGVDTIRLTHGDVLVLSYHTGDTPPTTPDTALADLQVRTVSVNDHPPDNTPAETITTTSVTNNRAVIITCCIIAAAVVLVIIRRRAQRTTRHTPGTPL